MGFRGWINVGAQPICWLSRNGGLQLNIMKYAGTTERVLLPKVSEDVEKI
jgi:hypothetical protein